MWESEIFELENNLGSHHYINTDRYMVDASSSGREGDREAGREGGREEGRQGGREAGR